MQKELSLPVWPCHAWLQVGWGNWVICRFFAISKMSSMFAGPDLVSNTIVAMFIHQNDCWINHKLFWGFCPRDCRKSSLDMFCQPLEGAACWNLRKCLSCLWFLTTLSPHSVNFLIWTFPPLALQCMGLHRHEELLTRNSGRLLHGKIKLRLVAVQDDFVMFCPEHADCKFPRRKRCKISPMKGPDVLSVEDDGLDKSATPGLKTGERQQKWPTGPACKWILCGSGLDSEMKVHYYHPWVKLCMARSSSALPWADKGSIKSTGQVDKTFFNVIIWLYNVHEGRTN